MGFPVVRRLFPVTLLLVVLFAGCKKGGLGLIEVEGAIYDSEEIVDDLKKFEENPMIKGVLIVVNSPGGGVGANEEIYYAILRLKDAGKKVVVYMSSMAASGGYYISLPADVIVALPSTITGSIGVILTFAVYKDLLDKVGIQMYAIKSRDQKDMGSGFRYPADQDTLLLKSVIDDVYDQFLEKVVEHRDLSYDSVYAIADGRIVTGRQAYEYGLVDTLGTRQTAHQILAELCGMEGTPELVEIPKPKTFWEEYFESKMESIFIPSVRYQFELR